MVSVDVRKKLFGRGEVCVRSGTRNLGIEPRAYCLQMQQSGAGELFVQSIDLEGARTGYDLALMKEISAAVQIPVMACGGAGSLRGYPRVLHSTSVAAAAAGTMFVLHGRHKAPLISYPRPDEIAGAEPPTPRNHRNDQTVSDLHPLHHGHDRPGHRVRLHRGSAITARLVRAAGDLQPARCGTRAAAGAGGRADETAPGTARNTIASSASAAGWIRASWPSR